MTELGKQVWKKMEEMGWENAPVDFHLEYYENIIECTKQALTIEAIKELEHIEEWLNSLGQGWNYFGGVDRAKQRLKNTMNIIHNAQNQPS